MHRQAGADLVGAVEVAGFFGGDALGDQAVDFLIRQAACLGGGFENICRALQAIARRGDVEIVYPVHRNPNVTGPVNKYLGGIPDIHLIEPLDYVPFVDLMRRAHLLLTDSGGIQEEGPSLGKPVIVMRGKTERPEAIEAGTVVMAGTDEHRIIAEVTRLLEDPEASHAMSRVHNPYGDGHASERIAAASLSFFRARSGLKSANRDQA